jgi:hypothetical protein
MEVYVLDSLFRRTELIDRYESLVWTERWADIGDFELHLQSTPGNRRRFPTGTRLAISDSMRVMIVETVENTTDEDGRKLLKVKGRSLEKYLDDRLAIGTYAGYAPLAEWRFEEIPEWIARAMFQSICVNGDLHPNDVIPYIVWGPPGHPDGPKAGQPATDNAFPPDTIPESDFQIDWNQKPDSLYKAIKGLADSYEFGFRLYRNGDTSQLFFNIYTGSDRTTRQTLLTPVVFSPDLGNVRNTTDLTTIEKTKNCAYLFHWMDSYVDEGVAHDGYMIRAVVYTPDVDPSTAGFERRVMYVEAQLTELENTPELIEAALNRQGLEALAKARAFTAFDGEISQYSQYVYGKHYFLGDLVSMQNNDGFVNHMRVTEQIFVSDKEGVRSYPTLAVNTFIQPGTWESWGFQAWEDVDADEYWSNQP